MCNYYKENGKQPFCTHECDGCMWHEPDITECAVDEDWCYECTGLGDDYSIENGELVRNCDNCPNNPVNRHGGYDA